MTLNIYCFLSLELTFNVFTTCLIMLMLTSLLDL